jgi:hypothetical protein
MSSTVEAAIEIRPFHVDIPDQALEDLRRRLTRSWTPTPTATRADLGQSALVRSSCCS